MKTRNIILIVIVVVVLLVGLFFAMFFYNVDRGGLIGPDIEYCEDDNDCTYANIGCDDCTCHIITLNTQAAENSRLDCTDEEWAECGVFCERPINIRCESNKCVGDW